MAVFAVFESDSDDSQLGIDLTVLEVPDYRQPTSFIEISKEAGKLLGRKHKACFVLGVAGIEPMPS